MFLPKGMEDVTYFGMGPYESYKDKHRSSWHGLFSAKTEQLHEDYLRPQENGSHYDCDFVSVSGNGLRLDAVGEGFSFNASPYSQEELTNKAHNYELEACGHTVLCLDYAQNGIGSNSCGPKLSADYALNDDSFQFDLSLYPARI
jgi:beta-galactosidase